MFFRIVLLSIFISSFSNGEEKSIPNTDSLSEIKSYCLDFNWAKKGFAKAGDWKDANPAEHVAWYKAMGANVIQTFAVSCNGYAWYKSSVVPEQPGLKHDFLREMVKLGHAEKMKVMGYFCIGANTRWGRENPHLSYGTPSSYHIPYTDEYLKYLSAAISDAVKTTGIDGFMIDWVWMPKRKSTGNKWIESEKSLYKQLMGEKFPGEDKLTKTQETEYSRKAIDRCWQTIREAAKTANPECIIWLTTNSVNHPHVMNSNMYKEVDWLMGEKGNLNEIEKVRSAVGENTRLITCLASWNGQDATEVVPDALNAGIGLYGFSRPRNSNGTIDQNKIFPRQITELHGDDLNITILARAYRGRSIFAVWDNGKFKEPETLPPFSLKFRKRRGFSDTAKWSCENNKAEIIINTPYQSGRCQMTRVGDKWPESIILKLKRKGPDHPGPTHFRIANGEIGVAITRNEKLEVLAGEMKGFLELNEPWTTEKFLNGVNSSSIKIAEPDMKETAEFVVISLPKEITKTNPSLLTFEWLSGNKVR